MHFKKIKADLRQISLNAQNLSFAPSGLKIFKSADGLAMVSQ
jgi:hypothetical protein